MARPADDSGTIPGENEKLEKIQTLDEEVGDVKQELNPHGPPNGGWEAWSTVFGTSLVAFGTFGCVCITFHQ